MTLLAIAASTPSSMPPIPEWLKAVLRMGPTATIAILLTWFLAHDVRAEIQQMRDEQKTIRILLEALCLNAAENDLEARRCEVGR